MIRAPIDIFSVDTALPAQADFREARFKLGRRRYSFIRCLPAISSTGAFSLKMRYNISLQPNATAVDADAIQQHGRATARRARSVSRVFRFRSRSMGFRRTHATYNTFTLASLLVEITAHHRASNTVRRHAAPPVSYSRARSVPS